MNKKLAKYQYSEELAEAFHFGNINFEKKFALMIAKLWSNFANKKIQNYQSLYGNTVRKIHIPISDGSTLLCYIIEPKKCLEKLPGIVYYHGGGFMFQLQELMFRNSDYFVKKLNCRVFLPEYRVVPKHTCTKILIDCYEALEHICKNDEKYTVDKENMIVYGDSAGGCLAASVTQMCKDRNGPQLKAQLLIYPVIDNSSKTPSMEIYKDAVWSRSANEHMWNLYLKGTSENMKYAVPIKYTDYSALPKTYIEVAEIDTLRDEGILYAEKLKNAGVPTDVHLIKGAYHGFDSNYEVDIVKTALNKRIDFIKRII